MNSIQKSFFRESGNKWGWKPTSANRNLVTLPSAHQRPRRLVLEALEGINR
jgi:hypothetical protein